MTATSPAIPVCMLPAATAGAGEKTACFRHPSNLHADTAPYRIFARQTELPVSRISGTASSFEKIRFTENLPSGMIHPSATYADLHQAAAA